MHVGEKALLVKQLWVWLWMEQVHIGPEKGGVSVQPMRTSGMGVLKC